MKKPLNASYQCQICFERFRSQDKLRDHISSFQTQVRELSIRIQDAYMHRAHAVHLDPTCDKDGAQNRCQTCSEVFDSMSELHIHIWHYQREALQLSTRMQEAQMHLAEIDSSCDSKSKPNGDHPTDPDHPTDQAKDHKHCPHPKCRGKGFRDSRDLARHYTIHMSCSEMCVFCREMFTQAQRYLRHTNKCNQPEDNARTAFTRHRRSQLQDVAAKDSGAGDTVLNNKRRGEADECSGRPRKRQRADVGEIGLPLQADRLDFVAPSFNFPPPMQGSSGPFAMPLLPPLFDMAATPNVDFTNASFSDTSFQGMEGSSSTSEMMSSQIFYSGTVPGGEWRNENLYELGDQGVG